MPSDLGCCSTEFVPNMVSPSPGTHSVVYLHPGLRLCTRECSRYVDLCGGVGIGVPLLFLFYFYRWLLSRVKSTVCIPYRGLDRLRSGVTKPSVGSGCVSGCSPLWQRHVSGQCIFMGWVVPHRQCVLVYIRCIAWLLDRACDARYDWVVPVSRPVCMHRARH